MNMHVTMTDSVESNMTSKGQVLIPKGLRERAGLSPDGPVRVGLNDRGEIVVAAPETAETPEDRMVRFLAGLEAVRGTSKTGFANTEDYMDFMRPHRREDW